MREIILDRIKITFISAFLILCTICSTFLAARLIFDNSSTIDNSNYERNYIFFQIVIDLIFIITSILAAKIWSIKIWITPKKVKLKIIVLVILICVSFFLINPILNKDAFIDLITNGQLNLFKMRDFNIQESTSYLFLKTIVLAPIYEEIIYRRIIFTKLKSVYSVIVSMMISSFLFAIAHLDFSIFFQLFFTGMILAIIYYKTKSLIITIIFHSISNLFFFLTVNSKLHFLDFYGFPIMIFLLCFAILIFGLFKLIALKNENYD